MRRGQTSFELLLFIAIVFAISVAVGGPILTVLDETKAIGIAKSRALELASLQRERYFVDEVQFIRNPAGGTQPQFIILFRSQKSESDPEVTAFRDYLQNGPFTAEIADAIDAQTAVKNPEVIARVRGPLASGASPGN